MKLPIIQAPGQRSTAITEDDLLINCYPEQLADGRIAAVKRPGVALHNSPASTSTPRGLFSFNGELVSIFGTTAYHNTTSIGTVAGTGPVWAAEYGTATKYLAISDGTNKYTIDTSWNLTTVSDADAQTHVHGVVHLNGYLATLSSVGVLQNSAIRDFTAWASNDVKNAESYADGGVALVRHLNYILAIGQRTIEPFYDAANAENSPFDRVDGGLINVGCANARTIASLKEMPFFVSDGGAVFMLNRMEPERISTPAIERIIQGATLTDAYAMCYEYGGHGFYVLTMPTTNVSLAYDVTTKRWLFLQDPSGNCWPYVNACQDGMNVYFQRGNGLVYKVSGWQDATENYTVKARTPWVDFGTGQRKILRALEVMTDIGAGDLSVRYTKDDFDNWSTARTASTAGRTIMRNFGQFNRMAFEFSHTANEGLRLIECELDVVGMPGFQGAQ